jgi:antitoxin component of MazEF toxin-antitoxin module
MQFKAKFFKNKIKLPSNVVNELGLENGNLVEVDLEKSEE